MTPEGQGTGPTLCELLARAVDTFEAMERMSGAHVRKWYSDSAEATRAAAARLREVLEHDARGEETLIRGLLQHINNGPVRAHERLKGRGAARVYRPHRLLCGIKRR